MLGAGLVSSVYNCPATFQGNWRYLASNVTTQHTLFCFNKMLETGVLTNELLLLYFMSDFVCHEITIFFSFHVIFFQITTLEDVSDISQCRFWELVPGHVVGSLSIQVRLHNNLVNVFVM